MFESLLPQNFVEEFSAELEKGGISGLQAYSKGTTSLVFTGNLGEKKVIVKLQRPDSPRNNFETEAKLTQLVSRFGITPPLLFTGVFKGLNYMVREFASGEPILYADLEKSHIIEIALKAALLDRLGLDHGQIQGGKHIIIGEPVYFIDFEKANWRRPRNLTSAMAMMFLGDNSIAKRIREKFSLGCDFLDELRNELVEYKKTAKLSGILRLLSRL
ncbi:serine/threonine protein kinase [Thermococcus waiotapuensis]|uniref:Serine/threonine protein kinase n=1 Tax=Thermococcus waiotapuensis TaxID=90909 RepID=A0AAE4NXV0_9EURY|nr:serine/threonine protein kinase [Thermococcus waiotapuensis]MDV3104702.1 serine/threonine protein kinase [Thermococcus waiotapuensis]